jgi:hypothetical protein
VGGKSLLGTYKAPTSTTVVATATASFTRPDIGTMTIVFPNGSANRTIPISRFAFASPSFEPSKGSFQSGWWWNDQESGTGYFIELQGTSAFIASFMYDTAGQPTWYASSSSLSGTNLLAGALDTYANGQALGGTYKSPTANAGGAGSMSYGFTSDSLGSMTLPNASKVAIKRFVFDAGVASNHPPVPNAGPNQTVTVGDVVNLTGSGTDADGDPLTFSWRLLSAPTGSTTTINTWNTSKANFVADAAGTYRMELIADDGKVSNGGSVITVLANVKVNTNIAPIANAGANQYVSVGATVNLNGWASSDANGDKLTYAWTIISKPSGSTANLSASTTAFPSFTADVAGNYVVGLTVNDGNISSPQSSVNIIAIVGSISMSAQPFDSSVTFLPDLKGKYDELCGRNVNAQQIIPVDLNNDGRKDFVVAVWCMQTQFGLNIDVKIKNSVFALLQNQDGSFTESTAQVFGDNLPDLGGVPISSSIYDFNKDGYTDIVFAINREDGRVGNGTTQYNFKSPQMSLMSNGDGTYRLVPVGIPRYGIRTTLRTNELNSKDVMFSTFSGNSAYRWTNNQWQEVLGYDWIDNPIFLNGNSNIAVQPSSRESLGVDLYNYNNSTWSKVSSFSFAGSTQWVNQVSWSGGTGKVPVITIGGEDYITPGFGAMCEIKSQNSTKIVAFMYGTVIVGGYKGGTIHEGKDPVYAYKNVNKLLTFDINGLTLLKNALEIDLSSEADISFYDLKCDDINNDGNLDLQVVTPLGWIGNPQPAPIVLLGNSNFTFNKLRKDVFPIAPNGTATLLVDVNGDKVTDLIYWPLTGFSGPDSVNGNDAVIKSNSVKYKLYKGLRHFNNNDMQ